ncbi:MAG: sensor histidine kinase [Oscillospiraceae bacterium]
MKQGVFFKNFLFTAWMFAMCFIAFGLSMIGMGRAFLIREQEKSLYASADEVKLLAEAVQMQDELNSMELRMTLAAMSRANGTHIFLCNRDGVVLTSSDTSRVSPYIGQRLSGNVMSALRSQDVYQTIGDLDGFYDSAHNIVAEPMDAGRSVYIFVTSEAGGFLQAWSGFIVTYVLIALGVLALALCFQYVYSRRLSRPLGEMAEAARRFGRGDYSARISDYDEPDEIGTLTEAFNAMAESLSRNEERRSEFVANVSHELRTPMTTIAGFADGLLDGTIPAEDERKYLEKISSETKRLSRLVRTMLDMSRLQGTDPGERMTRFDLTEMVVQTVLSFETRVTKKHLDMTLNMPEESIFVRGDVDALTRVVYNLADNAIKFAPEGTELLISVWKENGLAYTSVQNHGETIPREELPLIFERFHKSDRSRSRDKEGVGLGLYMVRSIIAAHQQNIFVTSENGVTVFTFTLALAEDEKSLAGERKL